jgi:AcrR family transcriptional regulator
MTNRTGLQPRSDVAASNTRSRILETALELFNTGGLAKTSTNHIAAEIAISPGNLYYHFRNKEQITEWLVRRFEARIQSVTAAAEAVTALDDLWLAVHLNFEAIHAYRFIFRDIDFLMRESPKAGQRVRGITAHCVQATQRMCRRLAATDVLRASAEDLDALALQMVFTATCWLSFAKLLPNSDLQAEDAGRAAYQVLTLLAPYLAPDAQLYLTYLRSKYSSNRREGGA